MKHKISIFFTLLLSLGFLAACGNESVGQDTVESYLDALKLGEDPDDYIDSSVDGLIDVFEYEHLSSEQLDDEKDVDVTPYRFWEGVYKDQYSTFGIYKQDEIQDYQSRYENAEVISNTTEELILWDGESYLEAYNYLYNVTIANEYGEKLYKKIEFTVVEDQIINDNDDLVDAMVIHDIYIR